MGLLELKADTHRVYGAFKWRHVFLGSIRRRTYRTIVTLRRCQASAGLRGVVRICHYVFRALHRLALGSSGMDLVWTTQIGGGFAIVHGWGLVVSPRARIGRNVTLFHGVTLGQPRTERD
jgi:serine O-acetyltransferase